MSDESADHSESQGAASMGKSPAKNSKSAGKWRKGESGNPAGRRAGAPNKVTPEARSFARRLLADEAYQQSVQRRLLDGTAGALEILLWHYAWGRPKETVKLEGGDRRPATLVFLEKLGDPLAQDAPAPTRRALPRPPVIAEVSFEIEDVELPPAGSEKKERS